MPLSHNILGAMSLDQSMLSKETRKSLILDLLILCGAEAAAWRLLLSKKAFPQIQLLSIAPWYTTDRLRSNAKN